MLLALLLDTIAKIVSLCILLTALLALLVVLTIRKLRILPKYFIPFLIVSLAIVLVLVSIDLPISQIAKYSDEEVHTVRGTVSDVIATYDTSSVYAIKVGEIDGEKVNLSLQLTIYGKQELKISDCFVANGYIEKIPASVQQASYLAASTFGDFEPTDEIHVYAHTNSIRFLAREIQQSIRIFFENSFGEKTANFLSALLIGDKTGLSPAIKYQFRRLGLSHILALSGLHVSILVLAFSRLLAFLRVPRNVSSSLLLVLIPIYAIITGLSPSIIRAGSMCIIMILGRFSRREHDGLTSLAFAALCILLASPGTICDLGFWLSVMATLGVILSARLPIIFPKIQKHKKVYTLLLEGPFITLCATIFTLPISTYFFGQFSLLFLVANIIFPQLYTWFIYLSLLSIPLFPLRALVDISSTALTWLLSKLASIPDALLSTKSVPLVILSIVLFIFAFLLLVWKQERPKKLALATLSVFLALTFTLGTGLIIKQQDKQFLYTQGNTGDYVTAHYKGKTLVAITEPSRWRTTKELATIMDGLHENDIDYLYFPAYTTDLAEIVNRASGQYLICSLLLPRPLNAYEIGIYNQLSSLCEELAIPIQLLTENNPYDGNGISLTAKLRSPLTERIDEVYFSFEIIVQDTSLAYLSSGYSITPLAGAAHAPDILIYGQSGSNPVGYETFHYDSAPHTLILADVDIPLILSNEDKSKLSSTNCLQGIGRYSYPIK